MTFRIDDEHREAVNDVLPGPAGIVTAQFGHDFAADVDVADGTVIRLTDMSFASAPSRLDVLRDIVRNPRALDAVRRVVTATVFTDEEPQADERLGVLDRVLARLDLESEVPSMAVHVSDRELRTAATILSDGSFEVPVSPLGELRIQAVCDAIRGKLPDLHDIKSTGELLEQSLLDESMVLGVRDATDEPPSAPMAAPPVVLLSAGPDLAFAMTGRSPRLDRISEIEVALILPVAPAFRDTGGRLACYLVEPDHQHPIAHISLFAEDIDDGNRVLVARFRLSEREDLTGFEFVVLPAGLPGGEFIKSSVARSIMCGEIQLRTAIRLAQRGQQQEALARLRDSERAYRSARQSVPDHYWDRLRTIRRRIEDDDYPSDLIADSVAVTNGPTPR